MELPDLTHVREFAFDFETYDPDLTTLGPGFIYKNAKVVGIAIHLDTGYNHYFPLRHATSNCDYTQLKPWLVELFNSSLRTSLAANYRYDAECLWSMGIDNKTWMVDIQIIEALLDEEQQSYSLASITKRYGLPEKQKDTLESALRSKGYMNKGKPDWSKLWKLPVSIVGEYAEHDARLTYQIYQLQKPLIEKEELQQVVELESRLIPVLHDMRINGVPVDIGRAQQENEVLNHENTELLSIIQREAPGLNVFSPTQLGTLVRDFGYIPPTTDKGNDSIPNEYLLASPDERLQIIGKYRQQEKIRRDFIEGMILEGSYNGRLHSQWFQTRGSSFMSGDDTGGTRSGRIACSNPNLAQIPSRHPVLGKLVRSLFVPENGEQWFKGDLSQQEPRIGLHYAYIMKLTGAAEAQQVYINNPNTDYHTMVMTMVNAVRTSPINRTMAKTINLGTAYGMGIQKLSDSLGLSRDKAKDILDSYNQGFPFVKELMNACIQIADQRGYVRTILGRRRRFDSYEPPYFQRGNFPIRGKDAAMAKYGTVRKSGLHKAMNSIIQGSAAEQMKTILVRMHEAKIPILISLYDEIGASIKNEQTAKQIKEIAETAITFTVPHVMEYKIGANWAISERNPVSMDTRSEAGKIN